MARDGNIRTTGEGSAQVTFNGIDIRIAVPSTRYIDEFVRLKTSPLLLQAKLFPNAKEITESMATYRAFVRSARDFFLGRGTAEPILRERGIFLDVGAGHHPRTAAVVATRSAWQTYAIDPELRQEGPSPDFRRVHGIKSTLEAAVLPESITEATRLVLGLTHAHCTLGEVVSWLERHAAEKALVIGMPCCVPMDTHPRLTKVDEYDDMGVHSPHRHVTIWSWTRT